MITYRTSVTEDAIQMAPRMRRADVLEVKAATGVEPLKALLDGIRLSTIRLSAIDASGNVIAMFGVAPWPDDECIGAPWMLGTDLLGAHKKHFLSVSKKARDILASSYPILCNYVDARHVESIRWLKWAGFSFTGFAPHYGVERRPFLRFSYVSA